VIRAFRTELLLTEEQSVKMKKTFGECRYVYNLYLATQKEYYESTGKFLSGYDFSKRLKNAYLTNNSDRLWIKEVSAKAGKQSIMNAEQAFKRFFNKQSEYPSIMQFRLQKE